MGIKKTVGIALAWILSILSVGLYNIYTKKISTTFLWFNQKNELEHRIDEYVNGL